MTHVASMISALLSLSKAVEDADDLLPDEGASSSLMTAHANDVIWFAPLVAGLGCAVLCLVLHYFACRKSARTWAGGSPGWVTFWGRPVVITMAAYLLLCSGVIAFGLTTSAEFGGHLLRTLSVGSVFLWLFGGTALALSPMLARLAFK